MNKITKIVLGSAAAIGLLGGGTALALANNDGNSATSSGNSSVSVVEPGSQSSGGPGGQGMGQPPADGQGGKGMRGGGPIAEALADSLGLDADTVSTAVQEVEQELGTQGPPNFQSTEFTEALASKLGVSADKVSEALQSMPKPGDGQRPPGQGSQSSSSATPSAKASEDA